MANKKAITDPEFCGVTYAANFIGVAPATLVGYTDKNLLPCVRDTSGKRLIRRTDLEEFKRTFVKGNTKLARA